MTKSQIFNKDVYFPPPPEGNIPDIADMSAEYIAKAWKYVLLDYHKC